MEFLKPDWPAPPSVRAMVSTRTGGVSQAPYASLNLGDHVGDSFEAVATNRSRLRTVLPAEPLWMKQVHGTLVSTAFSRGNNQDIEIEADAAITSKVNEVLAVMSADCLPAFFTNVAGTIVGVAHAGWRGLCFGVLENTVASLLEASPETNPDELLAWLGPAIGPNAFEVGEDVYAAFLQSGHLVPPGAFVAIPERPGKYFANLYLLARARLLACGLTQIDDGDLCTVRDQERFFSHRRDAISGRFASLIWLTP